MIDLNLDANESIRLSYDQAEWLSDNHRTLDNLVLTDQGLYCIYQVSTIPYGMQNEVYRFNLADIIIRDGISQMEPVWIEDEECLQIQFKHGMEYFSISSREDTDAARRMLHMINQVLGAKNKPAPKQATIRCSRCGKRLPARAKYCCFCRNRVADLTPEADIPKEKTPVENVTRSAPEPKKITWYLAIDGKAEGPFDEDAIHEMAKAGQINRKTLVWSTGMQEWKLMQEVDELKEIAESIPPTL